MDHIEREIGEYKVTQTNCMKALMYVPTEESPLPNLNTTFGHNQYKRPPSPIHLPNLQNLVKAHLIMMYKGKCFYPIITPLGKSYPPKQPYTLNVPQQLTYKRLCHHTSALHHVKIKFTQVLITQNLENGNTRHFHSNMYTHHTKGYIKIYGVTEWAPAYWDSNNVHIDSKPHNKVTVNPIMVLPYEIPRDEQPTEPFDQLDLLPDAEFAHSTTGPANTTLIYDIMKIYTSNMAIL